jgi:hypothetical protein
MTSKSDTCASYIVKTSVTSVQHTEFPNSLGIIHQESQIFFTQRQPALIKQKVPIIFTSSMQTVLIY